MLKARSRKLSLVLILAMLMTMFAGLGTASAATGYSATHVPLVTTGADKDFGAIIVQFDNLPKNETGNSFIVKLPAGFDDLKVTANPIVPANFDGDLKVEVAGSDDGDNQAVVKVYSANLVSEVKFALNLNSTVPNGAPEAINANIIAQPGSVFADGVVQVAKTGSGAVSVLAGDGITVTGGGSEKAAEINFRENKARALDNFSLKLPRGFSWADDAAITVMGSGITSFTKVEGTDSRTVKFNRASEATDTVTTPQIWVFKGKINVDESVADFGDIAVTIGGVSNVSPDSVVVGKYADYGIEIVVDDPETEVLAGRNEQTVSTFAFNELLKGSLLNSRTIYVELPSGVRWYRDYDANAKEYKDVSSEWMNTTGSITKEDSISVLANDPDTLKIVIKNDGSNKGKIELKDAKVQVAANFTGDITAKIWGNAGISEEIVLGTAVAPISATTDVKDIKIGVQKQAAGNIVITETKAEAIDSTGDSALTVALPFDVNWGAIPTIEVVEGDLELGTASVSAGTLTIPVKTSSSKASKIEISDVTFTADRTVPEGEMKATFAGSAVVKSDFTNRNYVVKEVVANCVTPAPGETIGSGEFRIGSNIYYAGGVAKVMDVAPYIKGDRTYVPMRYLGEILGAEVVWDDAARTVTLTKGDTTVVFTIGSTSYTVNGEAKTADVAPEIANDRTMLPARFVAEAVGAVVGWDAATQTVLIQK